MLSTGDSIGRSGGSLDGEGFQSADLLHGFSVLAESCPGRPWLIFHIAVAVISDLCDEVSLIVCAQDNLYAAFLTIRY